jgi:hypothetical protein
MHLLFFVRVTEDDHLANAGWPEKVAVVVAKQPFANYGSHETSTKKSSSSKDEESSITGMFLEGPPCSSTGE